jgi:hypothetical protein
MAEQLTPANSDSPEAYESKETAHALPLGWVLLAVGLILWGVVYLWKYSPALGGWSQASAYEQSVAADKK